MPSRSDDRSDWPKGLREKPRGSGNFYWEAYDPDRSPKRKSVPLAAGREEAARREAVLLQARYDEDRFDPWGDEYAPEASVADVAGAYLEAHQRQAESTLANKRSLLRQLDAFLKERSTRPSSFAEIERRDVAAFIDEQEWAVTTRRQRLGTLASIFEWAETEGYREGNPARELRRRRKRARRGYRGRKAGRSKRGPLFPSGLRQLLAPERKRLQEGTRTQAHYLPAAFEMLLATGLRRAELCALCQRDAHVREVDGQPVTGYVEVRPWEAPDSSAEAGAHFEPKNEAATRRLPLVPRAALHVSEALGDQTTEDPHAPLFSALPRGGSTGRLSPDALSQHFARCRKQADMPKEGPHGTRTLHSLRHGFLSMMMMLRVSPYMARQIAGHSDLRSQGRYVSFAEDAMAGRAVDARTEALAFFCPGLPEGDLRPVARGLGTGWDAGRLDPMRQSSGGGQVEDVLFGGALYREPDAPGSRYDSTQNGGFAQNVRNGD